MPVQSLQNDWLVVRAQSKRELYAAENIQRLQGEIYFPQTLEMIRFNSGGKRRREFRTAALFPSYLFVRPLNGQWHELLRTFGVVGIVPGAGGYPARILHRDIAKLRAMEVDGFVRMPNAEDLDAWLQNGRTVRVTQGAYTGYVGLINGMPANERIAILLDYMGRKVPFLVRVADLEAA